ncbi:coat protein [Ustilaginoidea virens RNA virus 5]|uniref:coat protein n=1 Tax=Ustilaginoidea virens RNA virus 5 TaxID=1756615 RepID=UPI00071ACE2F|nr:coat protein [Ustilaginoidea virens RNA virus 5]ALP73430.1 coat protein [Ustilaginoidea virens RNA virus 5]
MANTFNALAGVLGRPRTGTISGPAKYRKYAASMTTSVQIRGVDDLSVKRILYEVGLRHKSRDVALAATPETVTMIESAYDSSGLVSDVLSGLARKFSNFSGTFDVSNLAGVVERLAKGLAADSAYEGGCTAQGLLGGNEVRVHALGTYTGPVGAHRDTVFIPRLVDSVLAPDVFSVMVHAVCGEGGIVATDLVELDANTREPLIRDVDDGAFSTAVVDALRLLGANFAASGQGELFSLAVVRGLNAVLTVVGHTDEGGVVRDVLRKGAFSTPYGAVHCGLQDYPGLPALASSSTSTIAGYCDSLLLSAAALVAHCDPGVVYNGSWYPTVLQGTSPVDREVRPGAETPGTAEMARRNKRALLGRFDVFSRQYTAALAKLFGLEAGGTAASRHLTASASLLDDDNRHLKFASVSPYFWVEPTSIIAHNFTGYVAEAEGFASLCGRGERVTRPAWEQIAPAPGGDVASSSYYIRFRGARACGYLHHFHGHANDGMAFVVPRQLDPAGVIHPGPDQEEEVRDRLEKGAHIGRYLWRRGQSPICAPGEFLNLGETMALRFRHLLHDEDGYAVAVHCPGHGEVEILEVSYAASAPIGISEGPLTSAPAEARRARTAATRALVSACSQAQAYSQATVDDLPLLASAPPVLRRAAQTPAKPSEGVILPGGGGKLVDVPSAPDDNEAGYTRGTAQRVVLHADAVRGPAVERGQRQGGGGVGPDTPATVPRPTRVVVDDGEDAGAPGRPALTAEGATGRREPGRAE